MMILNAFSLNMLTPEFGDGAVYVGRLSLDEARAAVHGWNYESGVGHADTAALFSDLLGVEVACQRVTVTLGPADEALVGQYVGPRLPEGTKVLPEGARVDWFRVRVSHGR